MRWVAVSDATLDPSAVREVELIDHGLPYLRLRWRSAHWRVYENVGPHALATPEGRARIALERLGATGFTLAVARPGSVVVRVRWTPYWRAAGACVEPAAGGWTRVVSPRLGTVQVRASFSLDRVVSRGRRCS